MGSSSPPVIEGYEVDRLLGEGGMGAVFQAQHRRLGRRVAIKVLSEDLVRNPEFVSRFLSEARVVNDARHPNIVDITDFIEQESPRCVAYVMELVEGPTLGNLLKRGALRPMQAVNVGLQLTDALTAVHRLGVVHRDLKPDNILVVASLDSDYSEVPAVKILDFGIAKVSDPTRGHKTATGLMLGTPAYMAPEQIAAEPVSPATDVYAVGEILYEMLVGRRAFSGEPAQILRKKLLGELPPLALDASSSTVGGLEQLLTRCLSHEPKLRPSLPELRASLVVAKERLEAGVPWTPSMAAPPRDAADTRTPVSMMSLVADRSATLGALESPRRTWIIGVVAAAAAIATLGVLLWPRQEITFEASTPAKTAVASPEAPSPEPPPEVGAAQAQAPEPETVEARPAPAAEKPAEPEPEPEPEPVRTRKSKAVRSPSPPVPTIKPAPAVKKPIVPGAGPVRKRELKDW